MSSIGQSAPLSHDVGRYGLGDTQKCSDKSTSSIAQLRLTRVIAMNVRKGLEFPVVAMPGVGRISGAGDYEHEEARLFMWSCTGQAQTCDQGKWERTVSAEACVAMLRTVCDCQT